MKPVFILAFSLAACGPFHYRTSMPRPPVCVRGGAEPFGASFDDYGTTYTPNMNGPDPSEPTSYLIPEAQAGAECIAPPWWQPPQ